MKSLPTAAWLLIVLYLLFFGTLFATVPHFPEHVATHFDAQGTPNGWMPSSAYGKFIVVFGLAFPLVIVALMYLVRYFPMNAFNLPNREYWLSPGHREETFRYFFHSSLWFSCLAITFVTGLHLLILQANLQADQHLSAPRLLMLAGFFLIGTMVWAIKLTRRFKRKV